MPDKALRAAVFEPVTRQEVYELVAPLLEDSRRLDWLVGGYALTIRALDAAGQLPFVDDNGNPLEVYREAIDAARAVEEKSDAK